MNTSKEFFILHFNDVYDIQEYHKEPVGGASRFLHLIKHFQKQYGKQLLTLFSGDIFAPSALSNIYKGEQMLHPIHEFNIDVACPGNHDFDYSLEHCETLFKKANIPWVLSNVYNSQTKENLAKTLPYFIKQVGINATEECKVGFIGLAEEEWLQQIVDIPKEVIDFEDYVHCAERLIKQLREEDGCQFIIALTHMRVPNDQNLIDKLPEGSIDFVLGAHDHIIIQQRHKQTFYTKSGTNFRNFGIYRISLENAQLVPFDFIDQFEQSIQQCEYPLISHKSEYIMKNELTNTEYSIDGALVNIIKTIPKDEQMEAYVNLKMSEYNKETLKTLFISQCDLEGRFQEVRLKETNLSNLYADMIRLEFKTEISFFNTGTLRADEIIHQGPLTYQTVNKIFPFPDLLVSFRLSGENLRKILENGLSKWPNFDGRFLGMSGLQISFDSNQISGQRIQEVKVNGKPIIKEQIYTAATQWFIAAGFDGFIVIEDKDFIISKAFGIVIAQMVIKILEIPLDDKQIQALPLKSGESIKLEDININNNRLLQFKPIIHSLQKLDDKIYMVCNPVLEDRIVRINQ